MSGHGIPNGVQGQSPGGVHRSRWEQGALLAPKIPEKFLRANIVHNSGRKYMQTIVKLRVTVRVVCYFMFRKIK